jgi:hypothetical protein
MLYHLILSVAQNLLGFKDKGKISLPMKIITCLEIRGINGWPVFKSWNFQITPFNTCRQHIWGNPLLLVQSGMGYTWKKRCITKMFKKSTINGINYKILLRKLVTVTIFKPKRSMNILLLNTENWKLLCFNWYKNILIIIK